MHTYIEQRAIQEFIDFYAPFEHSDKAAITRSAQEKFYGFLRSFYGFLYAHPDCLCANPMKDDSYPNRYNKSSYGKPHIYAQIKKTKERVTKILDDLISIGLAMETENDACGLSIVPKFSKTTKNVLHELGVTIEGKSIKD